MTIVSFIAGLVLLLAGAEMLVRGAARLASSIGISALVIGLTVVAFGTSAPELAVGLQASFRGETDIALGNVIGSNIFNVLFILGLAALVTPLAVDRRLIRLDVPAMIGASILMLLLALDGMISRGDGLLLAGGMVIYVGVLFYKEYRDQRECRSKSGVSEADLPGNSDGAVGKPSAGRWRRITVDLAMIGGGLVLMVAGSGWLVTGAVAIARILGVNEMMIALTIVAGGTSLPEVATSVVAGVRGQRDIAVGNVVGSNIFNIFWVLALSAIASPRGMTVASAAMRFDLPVMAAAALVCLPIFFTGWRISRWEGGLLLAYYLTYTTVLILNAMHSPSLPHLKTVIAAVVIPVSLMCILIAVFRSLAPISRGPRQP